MITHSLIKERKDNLNFTLGNLKSYFIGLEEIIDQIGRAVEVWSLIPEILTRPTVVCLWGMTGTGKTDLVRRFVEHSNLKDRYFEFHLDSEGMNEYDGSKTFYDIISSSNLYEDQPSVLFLDEIQKFRTITNQEVHGSYKDIWSLLSDGTFPQFTKPSDYLSCLFSESYLNNSKSKYKMDYYDAEHLKRILRLQEDIVDIMGWDENKKLEIVKQKIKDKSVYKIPKYEKLLIFIGGNLDEAYHMASDVSSSADVDADMFHNLSKLISLVQIKESLNRRFLPEQIARFGNSHIIFPALSSKNYEEIIIRNVNDHIKQFEEQTGIKILIDESVIKAIYRNGVFPTQGVRPLYSTINSFFDSAMSFFILKALESNTNSIRVTYNDGFYATIGSGEFYYRSDAYIDKEKRNNNLETLMRTCIHEAGHVITHTLLFGYCPVDTRIGLNLEDTSGYAANANSTTETLETINKKLVVGLGGRAAESVVFGENNFSTGCSADLTYVTELASNSVRLYGMNKWISNLRTEFNKKSQVSNTELEKTNCVIELQLQDSLKSAINLISKNKGLLASLAQELMKEKSLSSEKCREIFAKYGYHPFVLSFGETIDSDEDIEKYNKFIKDNSDEKMYKL